MKAQFTLKADGEDITHAIQKNFASLTLTDKRNLEADQLDIILSDPDGAIALPRRGVTLSLSLGFENQAMIDKGTFALDELEVTGPPDQITLRARSANFRGSIKEEKDLSYDSLRLGYILETIATRNDLKLAITDDLSLVMMDHIDQTNESDANFITRLAERYDVIATVKAGHLLFMPIGYKKTVSGLDLPQITIARGETSSFSFLDADRDGRYTGVKAKWHNIDKAQTWEELVGKEGQVHTLKEIFPNADAAHNAAQSKWQAIQRGQRTMTLQMAKGRPDLMTNLPSTLTGFKPEIDAINWTTGDLTHTLSQDGGYTVSVALEETLI